MIIRTAVYLDEKIHKQLRFMAVERDTSMTELVRQAIAEFLRGELPKPKKGKR